MSLQNTPAPAEVHESSSRPVGQRHDRIEQDFRGFPTDTEDTDKAPSGLPDVSITQRMGSAVLGSVLTSLLVTPLDVVRVRLQSQSQSQPSRPPAPNPIPHIRSTPSSANFANLPPNLGITACCREVFWVNNNAAYCVASPNMAIVNNPTIGSSAAECAAEEAQRKAFTSTFDGLTKIVRNEGLTTLWRGLTPTLAMAIPGNIIYFAGYDWLRYNAASPIQKLAISDTYTPLVAGSTARVLAALCVSPIEMFRTRMQASSSNTTTGHFRDTLTGLSDMVSNQGYRSLWRGLGLTLWRDVPFSAFYWWGYEYSRDVLSDVRARGRGRDSATGRSRRQSRSQLNHKDTLVDSFIAGAASGMVSAFVTTPFDVGKTRQQVVRHSGEVASRRPPGVELLPEERSMPRFLWHIFKEQGVTGLFRGWAPRCLKVAPACAIMISTYEIGKKMATGMNEKRGGRRLD